MLPISGPPSFSGAPFQHLGTDFRRGIRFWPQKLPETQNDKKFPDLGSPATSGALLWPIGFSTGYQILAMKALSEAELREHSENSGPQAPAAAVAVRWKGAKFQIQGQARKKEIIAHAAVFPLDGLFSFPDRLSTAWK